MPRQRRHRRRFVAEQRIQYVIVTANNVVWLALPIDFATTRTVQAQSVSSRHLLANGASA
jgi:hypothetical protein